MWFVRFRATWTVRGKVITLRIFWRTCESLQPNNVTTALWWDARETKRIERTPFYRWKGHSTDIALDLGQALWVKAQSLQSSLYDNSALGGHLFVETRAPFPPPLSTTAKEDTEICTLLNIVIEVEDMNEIDVTNHIKAHLGLNIRHGTGSMSVLLDSNSHRDWLNTSQIQILR